MTPVVVVAVCLFRVPNSLRTIRKTWQYQHLWSGVQYLHVEDGSHECGYSWSGSQSWTSQLLTLLFDDQHPTLKADFIMANPPFNLSDWGADKLQNDKRWVYGLPPSGNANFAWMQHMIHHLSPTGRIGLVLANGALSSQSGGEGVFARK